MALLKLYLHINYYFCLLNIAQKLYRYINFIMEINQCGRRDNRQKHSFIYPGVEPDLDLFQTVKTWLSKRASNITNILVWRNKTSEWLEYSTFLSRLKLFIKCMKMFFENRMQIASGVVKCGNYSTSLMYISELLITPSPTASVYVRYNCN